MTAKLNQERRFVLHLLGYWDDLRDGRDFPTAAEIDPEAIGAKWAACFLLRVTSPLEACTFAHLGAEARPSGLAGEAPAVRGVPAGTLLAHATGHLRTLLDKRAPVSLAGEVALADGPVLCRSLLLPLSANDRDIDHVLGAITYRPVAADAAPADGSGAGARSGPEGGVPA